jgi:hypothetical protein
VIKAVQVLDGNGQVLFEELNPRIHGDADGPRHTRYEFATPLIAPVLKVRFDASNQGGASDDVGLDNLEFSQVGGDGVGAFVAKFNIDKSAPSVAALSPAVTATSRVDFIDVTFDGPVRADSVSVADLALSGPGNPVVKSVTPLTDSKYRFALSDPLAAGTYALAIGPNILDLAGNAMDEDGDGTGGEADVDAHKANLQVFAADLAVLAVSSPSVALLGSTVPLVITITNAGNAEAVGPWKNALLLADNAGGAGALTLGQVPFAGSVPPHSSVVVTQQVLLPATASGPRWLGVALDVGQDVIETVRGNNTRFALTSIAINASDLIVTVVTGPSSGNFGQSVQVGFDVKNNGTAGTLATWTDRLYLSPQADSLNGAILLASIPSSPLAAGASYTRTTPVTLPLAAGLTPGSFFLVAAADQGNAQAEALENNNLRSRALTLGFPPLPDLLVLNAGGPTFALPGGELEIRWAVTNAGNLTAAAPWRESIGLSNLSGGVTILAELSLSNALAAGTSALRTQLVSVPHGLPAGQHRLFVTCDSLNAVIESNENNNTGWATNEVEVPATLSLDLALQQVVEGAPASAGTITRNTGTDAALVVTLANDLPDELTSPATVTIPAGQSVAPFQLTAPLDNVDDGDQVVTLSATAEGHASASRSVTVQDVDIPLLSLKLSADRVREGLTLSAMVEHTGPTNLDVTVFLDRSDSRRVTVPSQVIIPAGHSNVAFVVIAENNERIEPTIDVTINAIAAGFSLARTNVMVMDDDLPPIRLTLASADVSEGGGPQATVGTVSRLGPVTRPVTLSAREFASQHGDGAAGGHDRRRPDQLQLPDRREGRSAGERHAAG